MVDRSLIVMLRVYDAHGVLGRLAFTYLFYCTVRVKTCCSPHKELKESLLRANRFKSLLKKYVLDQQKYLAQ